MSDAAPAPADAAAAAPAKAGGSKIVPILVIVNSLLVAGVLAVVLLRSPGHAPTKEGEHAEAAGEHGEPAADKGAAAAAAAATAMGPTVKLADFVIHLRNPEADRYARMSFEIEIGAELEKEKVTAAMPRLRDAFIVYLSDRTVEELRGSEGLQHVKTELLTRARELLPAVTIKSVFITEFVVQ